MKKFLFSLLGLIVLFVVVIEFSLLNNLRHPAQSPQQEKTKQEPTVTTQIPIRSYIGIHYKMIDQQTAALNKLVEGAYIDQVVSGSPAEKAGLREEDIIIEFDGTKITGSNEPVLSKLVSEKIPGDIVVLKIWRNKEFKSIFITLGVSK